MLRVCNAPRAHEYSRPHRRPQLHHRDWRPLHLFRQQNRPCAQTKAYCRGRHHSRRKYLSPLCFSLSLTAESVKIAHTLDGIYCLKMVHKTSESPLLSSILKAQRITKTMSLSWRKGKGNIRQSRLTRCPRVGKVLRKIRFHIVLRPCIPQFN